MTERLDELDRMKRDFVSKVSHDLKTPLSSMQETISALLDELPGPLTPKQRQLLELNRDGGKRLSAMLSKLLDLSRIEAGLEPDFQMVDVVQLVRHSVERMNAARRERGLQTSIAEPAAPTVGTRRFGRACSGVRQLARERDKILTERRRGWRSDRRSADGF